jgi:hypothetical protein
MGRACETAATECVRRASCRNRDVERARADFGVIEAVLSRLANGQMKSIAWDPDDRAAPSPTSGPHTLKEFGLDPAEHRLTLGAGSTVAEILLGKATAEGDVYAKDASRSIVFTIEKPLADDLARNPGDFRSKDVFAFRAFTGTRLEITRTGKAIAFERKKGPEKDAVMKWVAVAPAPAADEAKIEDLVSKVATLRAESFVDGVYFVSLAPISNPALVLPAIPEAGRVTRAHTSGVAVLLSPSS